MCRKIAEEIAAEFAPISIDDAQRIAVDYIDKEDLDNQYIIDSMELKIGSNKSYSIWFKHVDWNLREAGTQFGIIVINMKNGRCKWQPALEI